MCGGYTIRFENESTRGLSFYEIIKRLIDIICSFIGLLVFSPLFIIIAIIIKLTSKGPVFFHKRELEKMEKSLICISLDLW